MTQQNNSWECLKLNKTGCRKTLLRRQLQQEDTIDIRKSEKTRKFNSTQKKTGTRMSLESLARNAVMLQTTMQQAYSHYQNFKIAFSRKKNGSLPARFANHEMHKVFEILKEVSCNNYGWKIKFNTLLSLTMRVLLYAFRIWRKISLWYYERANHDHPLDPFATSEMPMIDWIPLYDYKLEAKFKQKRF